LETDEELIDRHKRVKETYERTIKRAGRMKPGGNRDRAHRQAGSFMFTLLQVEGKMDERGLKRD
jgi:hypothetical protein